MSVLTSTRIHSAMERRKNDEKEKERKEEKEAEGGEAEEATKKCEPKSSHLSGAAY